MRLTHLQNLLRIVITKLLILKFGGWSVNLSLAQQAVDAAMTQFYSL